VGPDTDAGEKVGLGVVSDIFNIQFRDAAGVDCARRDLASRN
jgi:hypothetical protein